MSGPSPLSFSTTANRFSVFLLEEKEFGGVFVSQEELESYIEAYAASAVVTPLKITRFALPQSLWPLARRLSHAWGLLTRFEYESPDSVETAFLLVCKRAPLPRLKRTLFERTEVGVFYLLSKGNLSPGALKALSNAELLEDEHVRLLPA